MSRLDGVDREGGREDLLALDVARLPEVGVRAEVLDGRRQLQDRLLVLQRELGLRLRRQLAAELLDRGLERLHVLALLLAELLRHGQHLALELAALRGVGVELGLEVLERQRVAEDAEVAGAEHLGAGLGARGCLLGRGRAAARPRALAVAAARREEKRKRARPGRASYRLEEPLAIRRIGRQPLHGGLFFLHRCLHYRCGDWFCRRPRADQTDSRHLAVGPPTDRAFSYW